MSKREIKRLVRQAQDATGLSRREILEILGQETGSASTTRDDPAPAPESVNPLIRPVSKRTS